MHIYWIWNSIDKLIRYATLVKFDESENVESISLRQFKQMKKTSNVIKSIDFSNSENKDLLLPDHILLLD